MTDKIKARIQELVPEIMELKFGCEVLVHITRIGKQKTRIYGLESMGDWLTTSFGAVSEKDLETLGRPIGLEDVLKAIDKNGKKPIRFTKKSGMCSFEEYVCDIDGEYFEFVLKYKQGGCRCSSDCSERHTIRFNWTLGKTWNDQPEETKQFIGKILGV